MTIQVLFNCFKIFIGKAVCMLCIIATPIYLACNINVSFQVEPGSIFQRMIGGVKTGVILKNVSFATQSGEVTAILGSKGIST